jgi:hypothetical protein
MTNNRNRHEQLRLPQLFSSLVVRLSHGTIFDLQRLFVAYFPLAPSWITEIDDGGALFIVVDMFIGVVAVG